MEFVALQKNGSIATLRLNRGKVNAINNSVVDELRTKLKSLEEDPEIKSVIITADGKFFSFGFDIPEFLSFSKEQFTAFVTNFCDLYAYLFLYKKPVVAALNGHTVASGCMLASACDYRVMVTGKAKISLNEISFGSSVFAGSTEMLRFWIGNANATPFLYSGAMYSAEEAKTLGLVQDVVAETDLMTIANKIADGFALKPLPAFTSIKLLLRKPIVEEFKPRERASIQDFVDIWYSEATWKNLQTIQIR